MQWLRKTIGEWGSAEYPESNSALQRTGMLTKDQLQAFYDEGYKVYNSKGFVAELKQAQAEQKEVSEIINQAEKKIFEGLGIQGDFGMGCLGRVTTEYGTDPSALQRFFEFVEREELLLDEIELPAEQFEQKKAIMAKQRELSLKLQRMSSEERREFLTKQQEMMQHLHEMTEEQRREFLLQSKVAAGSIMHEMGGLSNAL